MQLEQHTANKLNHDFPRWPWLIQYAAQVIHTFKIYREDGTTSRQRIRSYPTVPQMPKFAEKIHALKISLE